MVSRAARWVTVEPADVPYRGAAVGEEGVRLGRHALEHVGMLQDRVEHERADPRHGVEAGDERAEHPRPEVGLGQELGVGAVQLEQVVDEVGRGVAAPRGVVRRRDLLVQLLRPRPGPAKAAPLQQAGRALPGDGRQQEVAHEDDEVVEVVSGRGAGGENAQLVGGDALQGVVGGYRPVGRPGPRSRDALSRPARGCAARPRPSSTPASSRCACGRARRRPCSSPRAPRPARPRSLSRPRRSAGGSAPPSRGTCWLRDRRGR